MIDRNLQKVAILYDSSYLMSNKGEVPVPGLPADCEWYVKSVHIIPQEVKEEISRLLDDDAKGGAARQGRLAFAYLAARPNVLYPSLRDLEPIVPIEPLLGPDSKTDKLLLAEARKLLESDECDAVFLATFDGGIQAEASLWRSKNGVQIWTPVNQEELMQMLSAQSAARRKRWQESRDAIRARRARRVRLRDLLSAISVLGGMLILMPIAVAFLLGGNWIFGLAFLGVSLFSFWFTGTRINNDREGLNEDDFFQDK